MKQLTIAVPSYNMEKMLPDCLDSMADERFNDALEVIVVDDGSSDRTADVARAYKVRWPEIFRVVVRENGGHGAAINTALEHATGRYFRIVDADDWVNTENMARLLERLQSAQADVILDEKTEVDMQTGAEQAFPFPEAMPSGREVAFEGIAKPEFRYHLALHTMSVKREILEAHRIRLLEKTFYVDSQFVLEATAFARSVLVLRMGIYYYRVGNAAQSVYYLNYVKRYEEHNRVLTACLEFLKRAEFDASRREYVTHSAALLARTQYNIALIFNPDRQQGRAQAGKLRKMLLEDYPDVERQIRDRYRTGRILNRLGIGYDGMLKLKRAFGRG